MHAHVTRLCYPRFPVTPLMRWHHCVLSPHWICHCRGVAKAQSSGPDREYHFEQQKATWGCDGEWEGVFGKKHHTRSFSSGVWNTKKLIFLSWPRKRTFVGRHIQVFIPCWKKQTHSTQEFPFVSQCNRIACKQSSKKIRMSWFVDPTALQLHSQTLEWSFSTDRARVEMWRNKGVKAWCETTFRRIIKSCGFLGNPHQNDSVSFAHFKPVKSKNLRI